MQIQPWWQQLTLRPEIISAAGSIDDVQMSLFGALHGFAGVKPLYADAAYYGKITYPSQNLVQLLADVAVRLAAPAHVRAAAPAVFRLAQSMGGGKSHGLVGLWHLAAHAADFAQTEIGQKTLELAHTKVGVPLPDDLGAPRVVVLACDNMTPNVGNPALDGPAISLHERFLWRLFEGDADLYAQFQPHHGDKSQIAAAIRATGKPVLILVDEIMDYVRQLSESSNADLAVRDMAFLKALCDAVNDVAGAALVMVMIGSDKDMIALDQAGGARRNELSSQLDRNGKPATVTSNTDFAAILRRRLFENAPDEHAIHGAATLFWEAMQGAWKTKVWNDATYATPASWGAAVARCYPFHPALLGLAEKEWSNIAGFQKVRSTIRIFAATAFVLQQRAQTGDWTPLLIGTGDLPLSNPTVREPLLGSGLIVDERTQANFRQVAATDIVGDDGQSGNARALDIARDEPWKPLNPNAAQRMASALFLFSIMGPRSQGQAGATETELKAAAFVPDAEFALPFAEVVLTGLKNPDSGLASLEFPPSHGSSAPRLLLSTRQTVNMLFRANRNSIGDDERDDEFAEITRNLMTGSPFDANKFLAVAPDELKESALYLMQTNGLDEARKTRLVVLDPRKFTLLNGDDSETREAIRAAFGIGPDRLMVAWPSSLVFAVVNTYRRNTARATVLNLVAWKRVVALLSAQTESDQLGEANKARDKAQTDANRAIKAAFQHVVYLIDNDDQREMKFIRLDEKTESALDGSQVWKALVNNEKAFEPHGFNAKALMANLSSDDYNRPLDEFRNAFWMSPKMPLLHSERELRQAIYDAIKEDQLRLLDLKGDEIPCYRAQDINLNLSNQRLAPPASEELFPDDEPETPPTTAATSGASSPETAPIKNAAQEITLRFNIHVPLEAGNREAAWRLFSALASAIDERASMVQTAVVINVPSDDVATMVALVKQLKGTTNLDLL